MAFKLRSVEMNDTLFIGGRNIPKNITEAYCRDHNINLFYERSPANTPVPELWIVYNGIVSQHPYTMVKGFHAEDPKDAGIDIKSLVLQTTPIKPPPAPKAPIKAQVEMPKGLILK